MSGDRDARLRLPDDWRTWGVHRLRDWLRHSGHPKPPYLDYYRKQRLVAWIEAHVITLSG